MKKIFCLVLSFLLIVAATLNLTACNSATNDKNDKPISQTETIVPRTELINPNFSPLFFVIKETVKPLTVEEINAIVHDLPDDRYESYPNLHIIPVSAVLYKGGEVININLDDPRLIKLVNFYNNSVYYRQYSYTQGLLDINYLEEKVFAQEFRLVLTFDAKNNGDAVFFDTDIQAYDTLIVTNEGQFVLIDRDRTGYEGQEDRYPYRSVVHYPLSYYYAWLDIFEF